jgi:flagellar basal-body rod protein FlgC
MINLLTGIQSTAAALDAEQTRLNVISENIANADTTHGPDGQPYRRQVVVFESALQQAMNGQSVPTLRVAAIEKDPSPLQMVYEPGNPDANAQGMVAMPNVDVQEEMADLISASRAYEANLAVVRNARDLADQTLTIDKR